MDAVRIRQLSRITFFIGAVIICAGIALYVYGHDLAGIGLIIVGMVVAVICLSITRFFSMYDFQHLLDRKKPPIEQKK